MDLARQLDAAALSLEMRVVLSSRCGRESYSDPLQEKINSSDLGFLTYFRGERQAKRDLPVSACCSNAKMLYFRRACPEPHVTRKDRKETKDWSLLSRRILQIKFKLHMNLYSHLAKIYKQGTRTLLEGKEAGYKRIQKTQSLE